MPSLHAGHAEGGFTIDILRGNRYTSTFAKDPKHSPTTAHIKINGMLALLSAFYNGHYIKTCMALRRHFYYIYIAVMYHFCFRVKRLLKPHCLVIFV